MSENYVSDVVAALRCDVSISEMRGACVREELTSIRTQYGWMVEPDSLRAWKKARRAAREV